MNIGNHIKELLFHHDCVIIPGFGGFVTSYQHAEIQRFKNLIYPPSKSILFNRRLQTNDGILINHIVQTEKADYKTAEDKVRQVAAAWNELIEQKKMLKLPDIGKIYLNSKNALVFLPELRRNYLTDTFGLKPVSFHAMPLEVVQPSETAKVLQLNPPTPQLEAMHEEKKSKTWIWAAAAAVIVLLALFVPQVFLQKHLPENLRIQQLDIFGFAQSDETPPPVEEKKPLASETAPQSGEIETEPEGETETSGEPETTPDYETASTESEKSPVTKTTPDTQLPSSGNFYVAFGTYDLISEAIRQKKQLDEQYGKTFEVFSPDNISYVVAIVAGNTQRDAETTLQFFQSENASLKIITKN